MLNHSYSRCHRSSDIIALVSWLICMWCDVVWNRTNMGNTDLPCSTRLLWHGGFKKISKLPSKLMNS